MYGALLKIASKQLIKYNYLNNLSYLATMFLTHLSAIYFKKINYHFNVETLVNKVLLLTYSLNL